LDTKERSSKEFSRSYAIGLQIMIIAVTDCVIM
jgi:hypothetical protein